MAAVSRWHYDIDFKTPDGKFAMEQTGSFFFKSNAELEMKQVIEQIRSAGGTDIKPYLREVRVYVPYNRGGAMAATIEEVQEQMSKMARSTNAAKVSIGWEAPEGGYFEVVYYIKKPRNK